MKPIILATDGGSRIHGNKAGQHVKKTDLCAYAYIIKFPRFPNKVITNSHAYQGFTNNQMELLGVIAGLNQLLVTMPPSAIYRVPFIVVSDSQYVVNAMTKKWLLKWKNQGFKHRKNGEYWKLLYILTRPFKHMFVVWVRGHQENKKDIFHRMNCYCDHRLNKEMDNLQSKLDIDKNKHHNNK